MATASIVLNTTKKLSNDEYAIALRVTHNRKSKYFVLNGLMVNQSIKLRCKIEFWKPADKEDNGLGKFRKSFDGYREKNEILEGKLKIANEILSVYDNKSLDFSFKQFDEDLKNALFSPSSHHPTNLLSLRINTPKSIVDYYEDLIGSLEEQQRAGMAGLYRETQSILKKFKPDALITDINFQFLEKLEYWMRNTRGNKDTTISVKMRNLQRVVNTAIEDGLFNIENYPFGSRKYSINKRLDHKTRKIAIGLDKISRIKALKLVNGTSIHLAQQLILFSFYCRGMNFIDMAYLKWEDISETYIYYTRKKTRGQFEIPRDHFNNQILEYFKENHKSEEGFVFPIFTKSKDSTYKQLYTRKKTALAAINYNLKKLAKMIDEPTIKLSTNVIRHSYATGLKRTGVQTSYITEALGHSTESQTQTYLDSFEKGEIALYEKKLFNQL